MPVVSTEPGTWAAAPSAGLAPTVDGLPIPGRSPLGAVLSGALGAPDAVGASDFVLPADVGARRSLDSVRIEADRIFATTPIGQSDAASAQQKTRARDLIRLFLNISRFQGGAADGVGPGDAEAAFAGFATPGLGDADAAGTGERATADAIGTDSETVLDAALDAALDRDTIGLISRVFRPTIEPTGLVSLSVAGLGNFIFLLSDARDSIRIVDADTGKTVASYSGPGGGEPSGVGRSRAPTPDPQPARGRGRGVPLSQFLAEVWATAIDVATEPLVILAAILAVIMWVLWTLRAREE